MVHTNSARIDQRQHVHVLAARIVATGALMFALAMPAVAASQTAARIRSTDAAMLGLFREGAERSATFRSLINDIDHTTGIVYVEFGYCAFGHLNGCLLPSIGGTHSDRYLRILVTPDKTRRTHDQLLALIAHELRHALEVLDHQEVIDARSMEAMYRKIGTPLNGQSGWETSAARAAGDAVLEDLLPKHKY
jgi:hypothetical protein